MMADTAQSKIDDWVTTNYGATPGAASATPTSGPDNTGMLAAASSTPASSTTTTPAASTATTPAAATTPATVASTPPAATTTPAAPAASTTAPKVDINSWYQSTLGRDADAAGLQYWQSALDSGRDAQSLYSDFQKAATGNQEIVKPTVDWTSANNYTGPQSTDKSTVADDWGRNVLGRNLTGAESAQWSAAINGAKTPQEAQQVYQQFLTSMGGQVKNSVSLAAASQISQNLPNAQYQPVTIDQSQLTHRTIDKPTETVQGQLGTILAADSPVLQQARADAMRAANDRGMLNSAMAASGGEDAVIRSATGIATTDAGAYNNASNYNAAADNQALMYNAQAQNAFQSQTQQLDSQAAMQDKSLASQQAMQTQQLGQQMTLAQIQDATARWTTEQNTANSRYNTDQQYKQQVDNQKLGVANNIMQNMDLSPDRKAAMLEALGFGTSAKDGQPGTGLAGAVYVVDSTSTDLNFGGANPAKQAVNGMMSALG